MHKQVIPAHQLAAARTRLWKAYGLYAIQLISALLVTIICLSILIRSLFPAWTMAFAAVTLVGMLSLWFVCFPHTMQDLAKSYRMWQLKKDIRYIVRNTYGYATEDNVDSINRVVKTIMEHVNMGKFRNAPKEYYNLISLNPVETAALYGDSYVSFGSMHIRLPLMS